MNPVHPVVRFWNLTYHCKCRSINEFLEYARFEHAVTPDPPFILFEVLE